MGAEVGGRTIDPALLVPETQTRWTRRTGSRTRQQSEWVPDVGAVPHAVTRPVSSSWTQFYIRSLLLVERIARSPLPDRFDNV